MANTSLCSAVLKEIDEGRISGNDVIGSVISVSRVAVEQMDGTSAALYSYVDM